MQQTQKYKLNLIESSDPFLPEGLNQNTQKIEDVLAEKMEGPMVDLAQRVTALEAHRLFIGTYTGTGRDYCPRFVALGFTPTAVCVSGPDNIGHDHWTFTGAVTTNVNIVEGGFTVGTTLANSLNEGNTTYSYFGFY